MTEKKIPTTDVYSLYEAHQKIYPREVKGRFTSLRFWVVCCVWVAFYGLAWLQWDGRQAVLFDLPARQFHIFGLTFWPQDFYLLTWLLIIGALTLFLVTAVAGRIWCGFTCPQTVWTEAFLYFERLTEGTYRQRKKLDESPWNWNKVWRKSAKQCLWVSFALWTGFTFVGYFTPIRQLADGVIQLSLGGWEWFWFLFYSLATYGNAGYLREQVCQYMCPYARFQGAMLDRDSYTVSYDALRGEPRRGRLKESSLERSQDTAGDCINCNICVQVCPTGIDIRDGSQYECIGCTACIDACDQVMDRVGKPLGLVRYASARELEKGGKGITIWSNLLRTRILLYVSLWAVLCVGFLFFVIFRSPVAVDVIRDRNAFFQIREAGFTDNVYSLKIMNKSQQSLGLRLSIKEYPDAILLYSQDDLKDIESNKVLDLPVRVRLEDAQTVRAEPIHFLMSVIGSDKTIEEKTLFWRPQ